MTERLVLDNIFVEKTQPKPIWTKEYTVKSGDTLWRIASQNGISDFRDIVSFNKEYWVHLEIVQKWKKVDVPIAVGQTLYLPNDLELFSQQIQVIKQKQYQDELNRLVSSWDREALSKELNERIFPTQPISLGMDKVLWGFLATQRASIDPILPRIVDSSPLMERKATCSHFVKMLLAQSVNVADLKPQERKLLETANIDAWVFPAKAMEIGFHQKFNLMKNFDGGKITSGNPIIDEAKYQSQIIQMWEYLKSSWVPGSLLPIYFKRSSYKSVVASHNEGKQDKHYNTHMAIFAGNNTLSFSASEIPEIKNGKKIPFVLDNSHILKSLETQKELYEQAKDKIEWHLKEIDGKIFLKDYPELEKRAHRVDERIETLYVSQEKDPSKKDQVRTQIKELLKTKDISKIQNEIGNITKVKVSYNDIVYLVALLTQQENILQQFEAFSNVQEMWLKDDYSLFDVRVLPPKHPLYEILIQYNNSVKQLKSSQNQIKNLEEKLDAKKGITVIDFIWNFIQSRADLSSRVFGNDFRKVVLEGLKKYWGMIEFQLNGQKIDIIWEFEKPENERIKISPQDLFDISWPMMLDGLHMKNSDGDRSEKMNGRTRFLFEFILMDEFIPTELLEPGVETGFRSIEPSSVAKNLPIKWVYDLRRDDTLEKVLKQRIPLFEKEAFQGLEPGSNEYEEKINYYYGLQIKGLQLSGYIENEQILNPLATNINRTIPYFESGSINKVFWEYIEGIKQARLQRNIERADKRDFIDVQLFPGDTSIALFSRIKWYINPYLAQWEYKNLEKIETLNPVLRFFFLQRVLELAIASTESLSHSDILANNFKFGWKFIFKVEDIDKILSEVTQMSFSQEYDGKIREIDQKVIDMVGTTKQTANLMKTALLTESYRQEGSSWTRLLAKTGLETYPIFQHLKPLNSYWDFQIRIWWLESGFSQEWPKESHLQKAFDILKRPDIVALLNEASGKSRIAKKVIASDLETIQECENILKSPERDYKKLVELLQNIFRIDVWSLTSFDSAKDIAKTIALWMVGIDYRYAETNVVGKIVGAALLEDKLSNHLQKSVWYLSAANQDLWSVFSHPESMESLEKTVLLANNLWEEKVIFWLAENFLLRVIEGTKILNNEGIPLTTPEIQVNMSGAMAYGSNTFIKHIDGLFASIHTTKQWQKFMIIDPKNPNKLSELSKSWELAMNNNMLKMLWYLDTFYINVLEAKKDLEVNPRNTRKLLQAIYNFVGNRELQELLKNNSFDLTQPDMRIPHQFLPTSQEFKGNSFRNVFFNYVNKVENVPRIQKS